MIRSALSSIITRPSEDCAESADKGTQIIKWTEENRCVFVKEHSKVHSAAVAAPDAKASSQTV